MAQQVPDTISQKKKLDSVKTVKYRVKDSNQKLAYKKRVISELARIDTLYPESNSVVFNYYSKNDRMLQKTIVKFARKDCISSELIEYFNSDGLLEYFEQWNYDCRKEEELGPGEKSFVRLLYHFERFEYDTTKRLTLRVFYYPTIPYSRRIRYSYDNKGNQQSLIKVIPENEFWDSEIQPDDSAIEKRQSLE